MSPKPPRSQPRAVSPVASSSSWISPDELRALLEVMARFDVSELTQTRGEEGDRNRLTIRRGGVASLPAVQISPATATQIGHATPLPGVGHHPTPASASLATAPLSSAGATPEEGILYVTSPLVGTFYRAPSPEAASFADVGMRIRPGQRLCIVEAMKLMNEIESEIEGTIIEILVENGKPVEYGQKLFKVRKG